MKNAPELVFKWDDPLLLDAELTGEEQLVRDSARDSCSERLMPRVLKPDASRGSRDAMIDAASYDLLLSLKPEA